jgi:hypothetical protein
MNNEKRISTRQLASRLERYVTDNVMKDAEVRGLLGLKLKSEREAEKRQITEGGKWGFLNDINPM